MTKNKPSVPDIHTWFELSYSSYMVLNRLAMVNMPKRWQEKFILLLDEFEACVPDDMPTDYWVRAKKGNKFINDPYRHYRHGVIKLKIRKEVANGTKKLTSRSDEKEVG